MSVFDQFRMYWRLSTGLRGFLKEPINLEQARNIIKQRLAEREKNLLTIVKRGIFENERSPYLQLLKLAGCEYGDLEQMVRADGIEFALRNLREEGVYLSLEEFKGRRETVRSGKVLKFRERDFDNPLLLRHLELSTSGSRGAGTRTYFDLDYIALGRAVYLICLLDAYDALTAPIIHWLAILPGIGQRVILEHAKVDKPVTRWFSPVAESSFKPSPKNRVGAKYITYMGRLWGAKLPAPEFIPLEEAWRVAQCIFGAINERGQCYVHTQVSNVLRICQAAKERGMDMTGTKFAPDSEPLTAVKRREIESSGASACPRYASIEGGLIGWGCFHPSAPDDVHFFKDSLALIQHEKGVAHAEVSVDAFLFTSLLLSAPKILLNVELGDYGVVESRSCGCYWDELGLTAHIYNIRSFDKLTSQGQTFLGPDLIRLIEEVLPAKFGGTSIDYQMVEEEDEESHTRISIIVSPHVGGLDEAELIKTILTELGKGPDHCRLMAEVWSRSNTLRVKRMRPLYTFKRLNKTLSTVTQSAGYAKHLVCTRELPVSRRRALPFVDM
jgi:hypothetical protein